MKGKMINRIMAGRLLAEKLTHYQHRDDVIVLALPRGGVPVAYEIANALAAPLDIIVVRKLGIPNHEEFAMGAVAQGGIFIFNKEAIQLNNISEQSIAQVAERELLELQRRENLYRGGRPWPRLQGRCVILVDDGLATGATMRAAVKAVRQQSAEKIILAIPVASTPALEEIRPWVDEIFCLIAPAVFYGVGQWYEDFSQVSDEEVMHFLRISKLNC